MEKRESIKIADLGRVVTGKTPPTEKTHLYGNGYPFITPTDIGNLRYCAPTRQLSEAGYESQRNLLLPTKTVCVTCIASVGKICMTDCPSFTNQQINSIIVNESRYDPFFVYYLLQTQVEHLKGIASGSATPIINKTSFSEIEVNLPPLPVQRRIAGILSAYDDLIENNQRRIAVLEKMARSLYREWFVHFRYPGHEGVPLVDSALGPIPQGWEVKRLGDLTTYLNRGLAPSYDDSGNSVIINQKCIRDQRLNLEPARRQSKLIPLEKKVKFGDVLINSTGVGTLGRVAQVYQMLEEYTVDTHVTIARPNTETDLHFFGCTLLSLQETFDRLGVGATGQTELSRTSIANVDLVVPPKFIQGEFGKIVHSIRMDAMTYTNQTQNLRRTRDMLLPRLLSGQLDVGAGE